MEAVLGIDAAWTCRQPTGVALLDHCDGGWQCIALAPSYDSFVNLTNGVKVDWALRPAASEPNPSQLLAAAERLLSGKKVSLVTVDMPISTDEITGRREADNAVSREFGRAGCGTHSPSSIRPGRIGAMLSAGFAEAGYPVATTTTHAPAIPRLVEVYPHPALLSLTNSTFRLPYKVSKSRKYWPGTPTSTRVGEIIEVFQRILVALEQRITHIPLVLPTADSGARVADLKRYEDALDALVCGWVGTKYMAGQSKSYGDETAAIWIPP